MEMVLEFLEHVLLLLVECGTIFFELVGVIVLIVSGVKATYKLLTRQHGIHIELAKGISTGLSFMMGSEVLHTVTATSYKACVMIALILALRAALSILLYWESKHEAVDEDEE